MANRFLIATVVLLSCVAARLGASDSNSVEWRIHYAAADPTSGAKYAMTEITQLQNDSEDRIVILVEDKESRDRLLVTHLVSYMDHEVSFTVEDLETKEIAISRNALPFKSVTREGVLDESRHDPALKKMRVDAITLGINGVSQTASEDDWTAPSSRERRSALRNAASPRFLERLERLRAVVEPDSPLNFLCFHLLRYVLYGEACGATSAHTVASAPDCAFDASFKYPCSQESKDRIAAAKDTGRSVRRY